MGTQLWRVTDTGLLCVHVCVCVCVCVCVYVCMHAWPVYRCMHARAHCIHNHYIATMYGYIQHLIEGQGQALAHTWRYEEKPHHDIHLYPAPNRIFLK